MIENLLLAVGLIGLGLIAFQGIRKRQLHKANVRIASNDAVLTGFKAGRPGILYFTADWCSACQLQQRPALHALQAQLGEELQIIQVDVEQQPNDAKRWGVMSLPTTYILNADGEATAVNYGVASTQKLKQQLEG